MTSIHPTYLQWAAPLPLRYMLVSYTLQPEKGFEALIALPYHAQVFQPLIYTKRIPNQKKAFKMTSIRPTYLHRAVPTPHAVYIVSYTLQPEIGFEALTALPMHAPTMPLPCIHQEDPKSKESIQNDIHSPHLPQEGSPPPLALYAIILYPTTRNRV